MDQAGTADRPAGGFYFGWVIVFAAFLAFGIVYGTVTYSFTVFVNPLAAHFATTPTKVLLAFTLTNVGTGILGVFAGRLLMRHRIRTMVMAGMALMALGFLGLSVATALWHVYILYAVVVAFGAAIVAPLGASALVTNWFAASRGRALTLATLGTSFGQLLLPRVAAYVIDGWSWQTAYRLFALIVVVMMPLVFLLVTDRPEDKGLAVYSKGVVAASAAPESAAPLTSRQILGSADFWIIAISFLFCVLVYLALVGVMVPYGRTFGVSALDASKLVVTMGVFAIIGKVGFATFTDRMGLRNTFWIAIGLNLLACVLLVAVPGYTVVFVAAACAGASAGGVLPLWPGMIAHRFGRARLAQVMGLMSPLVVSLQGFGAPFATAVNFRPAYIVFAVMLLISAYLSRNLNQARSGGISEPGTVPSAV